jgi:hypothetical protein
MGANLWKKMNCARGKRKKSVKRLAEWKNVCTFAVGNKSCVADVYG